MAHAASIEILGATLRVAALRGRVCVSEPFRFEIETEVAAGVPLAADLVGADAALTLSDGFDGTLELQGFVRRAVRRPVVGPELPGEAASLSLVFAANLDKLAIGRDSRVFAEQSVVDLVKDVLARAGLDGEARFDVAAELPKHAYRAQARESDGELLARLLAEEGLYYWFEPGDGVTTVVFCDDSTTSPELSGGAEVPVMDGAGLNAPRASLQRVERRARVAPTRSTIRDYDPARPKLDLKGEDGDGGYELYDAPGRFLEPDEGSRLAKVRLEAARARASVVSGTSTTLRVWPGRVLQISGHERGSLDGRYFVVEATFSLVDARGAAGHELRIEFEAIPADVPFRAPLRELGRRTGPQTGVVVGPAGAEIHPDDAARVRVQLYWDRVGQLDDTASTWMRVGQFPLSGSMLLPRIGWDVLVQHHDGDADRPFVATHLYDGVLRPPYALPADKTKTAWQTATTPGGGTTNEIRFEDSAGSEEVFIHASFDMNVVIAHDKGEKVGVDSTHDIGADHTVTIGTEREHGIISTQDTTIGGSETLTVGGARETVVSGAESASIGGGRTVTAVGGSQLAAEGGRTLTVAGSAIAVAATEISRTSLGSVSTSIGGSHVQLSAAGVEDMVGGASAENVGGAKISIAGGGYDLSAKGALAESVGGAYVAAAGGNAGETAKGNLTFNVGGAFLGNAPSIEIEGKSKIVIQVGGASLTIQSSKIQIKAPAIATPAAGVAKEGADVKHN